MYFSMRTGKAPPHQQTRERQQQGFGYLRLCRVPYLPLGSRTWQAHGTFCGPQNSKLQGNKREEIKRERWENRFREKEIYRQMDNNRQQKVQWLKYNASLLTESRKKQRSDTTERDWKTTDVWARLLTMCPDGQSCQQADCSYCTVQCHLLTDVTGVKVDTTHTRAFACTWSTIKCRRKHPQTDTITEYVSTKNTSRPTHLYTTAPTHCQGTQHHFHGLCAGSLSALYYAEGIDWFDPNPDY